ncbi:MAG TPA: MFS transporter, partial [Solirubrobacteraceae bacterium]|nr:MFS transporter [Solirubrobacteraceae bacterium]
RYPGRSTLGATLMITQSFLYNAIFFTYATVLSTFFGVENTALYYIPFAIGNFLGPLLLGPLFDTIGRKPLISGTYILSGALLVISAFLFKAGALTATTQTIAWCVIFFFASAGASAAYLTVSEIFPMETRALCISVFYAVGTGLGGIIGPLLFSRLVATGKFSQAALGLILGASMMIIGGLVELVYGVKAEGRALEDIAQPLTAEDSAEGTPRRAVAATA